MATFRRVATRLREVAELPYASSVVFLVGVEVDELLREDAKADERGILDVLFGIGRYGDRVSTRC
jgi:hypothetical protein